MADVKFQAPTQEDLVNLMGEAMLAEPPKSKEEEAMMQDERKFAELMADTVIEDDLSRTAVTDKGAVGLITALDFATERSQELDEFSRSHPMYSIFDDMMDEFKDQYAKHHGFEVKSFPRGHSVVMMGCSIPFIGRNQGIERKLHITGLELYKERGYKHVMTLSYSPSTKEMCQEFAYKCIHKMPNPEQMGPGQVELMTKEL